MSDYKQPFNVRKKNNTAELLFENKCAENHIRFIRYGLDQLNSGIPGNQFITIEKMVRYTPDYIMFAKNTCFIEVKGCKDELGMKLENIEYYGKWNKIMPLMYFFYSTTYNDYKFIKHDKFLNIAGGCEVKQYPDNNREYYCVPWEIIK